MEWSTHTHTDSPWFRIFRLGLKFFRNFLVGGLGGLILGSLVACLEIVSLPYFYDDPIGEITITIAIPYMLYWLCENSIDL